MTPLFSNPDDYIYNLIAMTSPEAKRLWRGAIKDHFSNTCIYCGKTYETNELTLDHVHPKALGGDSSTSNLVCACRKCNSSKGTENWRDWMRERFGIHRLREHIIEQHIAA